MLRIRKEQLEAFTVVRIAAFKSRLVQCVVRGEPTPIGSASPEYVKRVVECSVPLDEAYRLASERHTARFMVILFRHLAGKIELVSAEEPQKILRNPYLTPAEKLDRFEEWAKRRGVWQW